MDDANIILAVMRQMSERTTQKLPRAKVREAALAAGIKSFSDFYMLSAVLADQGMIGYSTTHTAKKVNTWLTAEGVGGAWPRPKPAPTTRTEWVPPAWALWETARPDAEDHKRCPSRRGNELVTHVRPVCLGMVSSTPADYFLRMAD